MSDLDDVWFANPTWARREASSMRRSGYKHAVAVRIGIPVSTHPEQYTAYKWLWVVRTTPPSEPHALYLRKDGTVR